MNFRYLPLFACLAASCGPLQVDHVVSGEVAVNFTVTPKSFLPFAIIECGTRVPGQNCYDLDITKCASCLSELIMGSIQQ